MSWIDPSTPDCRLGARLDRSQVVSTVENRTIPSQGAEPLTIQRTCRLSELEEVLGELLSVENTEIGLIAVIGKVSVLLPEELAGSLQGLVGKRIGILRLDGYHLRCFDKEGVHAEGDRPAASGHEPEGSVMAVHFWDHDVGSNRLRSNFVSRGE